MKRFVEGVDRGSVARYLQQLDSADRQEPSPWLAMRTWRLGEKIGKLQKEMERLRALDACRCETDDRQISLADPDARSMATSGRGSGVVGYNVQAAVDTNRRHGVCRSVRHVLCSFCQLCFKGAAQSTVGPFH